MNTTTGFEREGNDASGDSNPGQQAPAFGLVRPKRRVIQNTAVRALGGGAVKKNYAVDTEMQFTNFRELANDSLSPDHAQEILEEAITLCGLDMSNAKGMRMVEDAVFGFYVLNAASPKTGHGLVIDVYGVEFDFMVLLRVIVSHETTPRRFVRGLATRIFEFLGKPENEELRVQLAAKHVLEDAKYATIAFDGATHVTNLPTDYLSVAHTLASRGIYDNMAASKNASQRTTYDGVVKDGVVRGGISGMSTD